MTILKVPCQYFHKMLLTFQMQAMYVCAKYVCIHKYTTKLGEPKFTRKIRSTILTFPPTISQTYNGYILQGFKLGFMLPCNKGNLKKTQLLYIQDAVTYLPKKKVTYRLCMFINAFNCRNKRKLRILKFERIDLDTNVLKPSSNCSKNLRACSF